MQLLGYGYGNARFAWKEIKEGRWLQALKQMRKKERRPEPSETSAHASYFDKHLVKADPIGLGLNNDSLQ